MRGVVLAGGTGSRLNPMTLVTNKHLLPIYNQPMIYYPIQYLQQSGIQDIMLITGQEHCGSMIGLLGDGSSLGVQLTYRVQREPNGIAGALRLCKDFVGDTSVLVILGDNLLENGVQSLVEGYQEGAMIFAKEVSDPQRFGVVTFDEKGKVTELVEKPNKPQTNWAVIGVYIYDSEVFDIIDTLSPSARGEYEITDINRRYLDMNKLRCRKVQGWWSDAGTIESMYDATVLMRKLREKEKGND